MPRTLTQYRVFIASPSGLDGERDLFRRALERFTRIHAEPSGVEFHAVGWEDTLPGAGRPQSQINEDLRLCDYAVFVLHDRWGTPTGDGHSSGVEEEWEIAERLFRESKIRNLVLYFKEVDPRQRNDAGPQLQKVIEFREKIMREKLYLFGNFDAPEQFVGHLEGSLAKWLRDHEPPTSQRGIGAHRKLVGKRASGEKGGAGDFAFWIAEAEDQLLGEQENAHSSRFCAERALARAKNEIERARGNKALGKALFYLNKTDEALATFSAAERELQFSSSSDAKVLRAEILVNIGIAYGQIGRGNAEIEAYDVAIEYIGASRSQRYDELMMTALSNKLRALGSLDRYQEEIAVCDELIARFQDTREPSLLADVGRSIVMKGMALRNLEAYEAAIPIYESAIARFSDDASSELQEVVSKALFEKGAALGKLDRDQEATATYEDLVARFGSSEEVGVAGDVTRALCNLGTDMAGDGRLEEALRLFDRALERSEGSDDAEVIAFALLEKGRALINLKRQPDALVAFDAVLSRFASSADPFVRSQVAETLALRAHELLELRRFDEALAAYSEAIERLRDEMDERLQGDLAISLVHKGHILAKLERYEEELETYNEFLTLFGGHERYETLIVDVLINRGLTLHVLNRFREAISSFDEVLERFSGISGAAIQEEVALAWVHKGDALVELGQYTAAAACFEHVLSKYSSSSHAGIKAAVVSAQNGKRRCKRRQKAALRRSLT